MVTLIRDEKGQALVLVLILLLVGGLIIAPLLTYMSTGLKVGQTHEQMMKSFYAADAGVEDALWRIKNDLLPDTPYTYPLPDTVNDKSVSVMVDSTWLLEGIESPAHGTTPHAQLVALGRPVDLDTGEYEVTITCDLTGTYQRVGGVKLDRIGVWLPPRFGYLGPSSGITESGPAINGVRGGTTLIWDLSPPENFPNKQVTTKSQFFYIEPVGEDPPGDFAWVRTQSHDIYLSWDEDFTIYTVTSIATDNSTGDETQVIAHVFRDTVGKVGIITWESR